jgi:hypothetical protein
MTTSPSKSALETLRREALASAAVNFAINAALNAAILRGKGPHWLSVDSIGSREVTVFGSAVPLAVSLSVILATITFFTFRRKAAAGGFAPPERLARPYFFFGLRQALESALLMFGAVVVVGVLWQRLVGSVAVSTPVAAGLAGLVAAVASYVTVTRTGTALLREF